MRKILDLINVWSLLPTIQYLCHYNPRFLLTFWGWVAVSNPYNICEGVFWKICLSFISEGNIYIYICMYIYISWKHATSKMFWSNCKSLSDKKITRIYVVAPMFVLSTQIFSLYTVCLSNFSTKIDLAFFFFPTIQKQV